MIVIISFHFPKQIWPIMANSWVILVPSATLKTTGTLKGTLAVCFCLKQFIGKNLL